MAAVGSVLMLLKRAWLERYKWAVLAIAGTGAVGAIFAAGSGDALEEGPARGSRPAIEEHADLCTAMAASIVLSATASVATVIDAGQSGATSSWGDVKLDGGTDDHDDRDGDDGV